MMASNLLTSRIRKLAQVALCAATVLCASPTSAADLKWRSKPFNIVANEKRLSDFMRELAASQGTTAVIDSSVDGTISGKFNGAAQDILENVCATYGLTWYYDGSFLFVDLANQASSEVIPIASGSASGIAEAIARLRIADRRFPLIVNEAEGSVFVSGPKRYVEAVKQAIRSADKRAMASDNAEVRLFPLKYAWAADIKITRNGKEVMLPGVVNVLRGLYNDSNSGGKSSAKTSGMRVGPSRRMKMPNGDFADVPSVEMPSTDEETVSVAKGLPQFRADSRMNAVLIRDVPERMAQYERLIASMDTRPRLVEIELTIMDVSTDNLQSIGVDWRAHGKRADVQIGNGTGAPLTWLNGTTEAGQTGLTNPAGVVLTASVGNELRNFLLARVRALSEKGEANFVARPKVLTLDNTEAALENMSEFYVRVPGFQDSSLYNITAGTAVRVTPLIIDEQMGRGVMLSVDIIDGSVSDNTVDNIPVVRRRSVATQAMVEEGTSLLIAGYSSEEKTNAVTGVPGLSSVPIIGNLFKYSEKKQINMERFYLITPRLVIPGASFRGADGRGGVPLPPPALSAPAAAAPALAPAAPVRVVPTAPPALPAPAAVAPSVAPPPAVYANPGPAAPVPVVPPAAAPVAPTQNSAPQIGPRRSVAPGSGAGPTSELSKGMRS